MRLEPAARRWRLVGGAAMMCALLGLGACTARWPWRRPPPAPPAPVQELTVSGGSAAGIVQYWKRNTLLLDLSGASGTGSIRVTPGKQFGWPVRLAVRVRPGTIGVLEVQGAQRLTLPISAGAGAPVDLELPPGVYTAQTPALDIRWAPAP
ncbi:MAG: hypothetical protein JSR67_04180 [Proteobacteria bacterium]|nr:hypothetical protein [Pseudomonadota bacterium]